jgi:hypothetical protein
MHRHRELPLRHPLHRLLIGPEVNLHGDQNEGRARTVVVRLRHPLLLNLLKRLGEADAEADEEDVGLWVGERAEAVVFFLAYVLFNVMDRYQLRSELIIYYLEGAHRQSRRSPTSRSLFPSAHSLHSCRRSTVPQINSRWTV